MDMKPANSAKIQFNRPFLPILVVILLVLQLVVPYQGWLVLLVGLGGGWLVSAIWAQSLAKGLHLERELYYGWAQVGDVLEERFLLKNSSWLRSLATEVQDQSTMPNYQAERIINLDGQHQISWQTSGTCQRRGLFMLGPTHVRTSDPLGLYTITQDYPTTTSFMVTPRIIHLPEIRVAPGGKSGDGRTRTASLEPTVSAAGVRGYAPGDAAHIIHWPTSVRRDSLYVRNFDNTPTGDWWIVLDLDRSVQAGIDDSSTEEYGIILAASLADRGLRTGRAVGLVVHGADLTWLPPRLGDYQQWQILRALTLLKPGEVALEALLQRTRPNIGQNASLIIITASGNGAWVSSLFSYLRRGVVPTVLLLDPHSFDDKVDMNNSAAISAQLSRLDIAHYLITQDLLTHREVSRD